ncbi:hypothetical protein MA4S0726RB_4440 [Mycobacteroides abscessus 4S-0726-RB]|nr:hypothetical protein MA4S0726RB_4440 [Mycobacteroides abscessus 4S-0726-RB]EIU02882.1 hypothetical protein MA4S0303_0223 [Mycobacteroides abscessus 4S-0303]EIV61076.1 hypothetical protein MA4S0116S_3983 [Mycobacteroides abscessus 4S-0116-S]
MIVPDDDPHKFAAHLHKRKIDTLNPRLSPDWGDIKIPRCIRRSPDRLSGFAAASLNYHQAPGDPP